MTGNSASIVSMNTMPIRFCPAVFIFPPSTITCNRSLGEPPLLTQDVVSRVNKFAYHASLCYHRDKDCECRRDTKKRDAQNEPNENAHRESGLQHGIF